MPEFDFNEVEPGKSWLDIPQVKDYITKGEALNQFRDECDAMRKSTAKAHADIGRFLMCSAARMIEFTSVLRNPTSKWHNLAVTMLLNMAQTGLDIDTPGNSELIIYRLRLCRRPFLEGRYPGWLDSHGQWKRF